MADDLWEYSAAFDGLVVKGYDYTATRKPSIIFECEDEPPRLWPSCEISGCDAGICVGMSFSMCYPHGIEFGQFTKEQFDADRAKRNGST